MNVQNIVKEIKKQNEKKRIKDKIMQAPSEIEKVKRRLFVTVKKFNHEERIPFTGSQNMKCRAKCHFANTGIEQAKRLFALQLQLLRNHSL